MLGLFGGGGRDTWVSVVHLVVTEYGAADLWGKSIRERANSLIAIAHPDHRGELLAAAKKRCYVLADQIAPRARVPWEEARIERTLKGLEVMIRPVRITDEKPLQDLFYRLSDESTYKRFMAFKRTHPHAEMQQLVELDYTQNMALVACLPESDEIVAMARYDVDPASQLAEIAFVVHDDWQSRGIGTLLMNRMKTIARARGLQGFKAYILATNKPMLSVFYKSGLHVQGDLRAGVYEIEARFDSPDAPPAGPEASGR